MRDFSSCDWRNVPVRSIDFAYLPPGERGLEGDRILLLTEWIGHG